MQNVKWIVTVIVPLYQQLLCTKKSPIIGCVHSQCTFQLLATVV